jgi:hypothetical protein
VIVWLWECRCYHGYNFSLFSVNYGGELSVWNLHKGKRLLTKKMDADPMKCVELFEIESSRHFWVHLWIHLW